MKIGVVSDTHRNVELLGGVVEWMVQRQGIDVLYHLGDDYEDVAGLEDCGVEIVQAPGIYHPGYRDGSVPAKVFESPRGVRVLLLHSREKDLTDDDMGSADVILSGHTHKAELKLSEGRLYMNPGHLKGEIDKHTPATFGMLDIQDKLIVATIRNLSFEVVERLELLRSESGLFRAT